MKAYGQLEVAQLENVTGNPATALAVGRVWVDVTTATAGIPKFYNGTGVQQLTTSTVNAAGSSGAAVTINWALGNIQTLTLSANCLVTFSNPPSAGQLCSLIVSQDPANQYQIRFENDVYWQGNSARPDLIPIGNMKTFNFVYSAAILPALSTMAGYNSPPVSVNSGSQVVFSPDGKFVAVATGNTNVFVYPVARGATGAFFGAGMYASNSFGFTAAGNVNCVAWHPSGQYIAVGSATSPYIQVVPVVNGAMIGGAVSNPSTLPSAAVTSCDWHPSGTALVYVTGTTPFLQGSPWSPSGFGTAYSNPGTLPTASHSVRFHPSGLFVAMGLDAAPGIAAYAFSTSSGFGTKSGAPTPSTFLTGGVAIPDSIAFSNNGLFVAAICTATPYVHVWPFSATGAFGTVVSNPATLPTTAATGCCFSPADDYLYVMSTATNVLYAYPFTATGSGAFGTLIAAPTTKPPTGSNLGCFVSPSGEYVGWYSGTTPFFGLYLAPRVVKNYIVEVS